MQAKLAVFLAGLISFGDAPQLGVTLPQAKGTAKEPPADLLISISKDGRYFFDEKEMEREALSQALVERHRLSPDAQVIFQADAGVPYGTIVSLMDLARAIGFAQLAIGVRKE